MCGEAHFRHVVHAVGADLHLHPLSLVGHEGIVERLVAVGLRVGEPVAEARGVGLVDFGECGIDAEALVLLLGAVGRGEDDADGEDVVDLLEGDVLVLHLQPDGIRTLHAGLDVVVHAQRIELFADGGGEVGNDVVAFDL